MAYWIVTPDDKVRPCLLGPYESHIRANKVKDKCETSEAKVVRLRTRNRAAATSQLKAGRVEEEGLRTGTGRFRHTRRIG